MASARDEAVPKPPKPAKEPVKLVLCFDGTGNSFSGSDADTNVVKLLRMLDRTHPRQYHYYQTGIGTYDINATSVNKSWLGQIQSFVSQTVDEGFATTFDAHVMAGYRFLMRYYKSGAKIYMFGFSRGAYTAKFLAHMISTVGLLCKGNEEMVPFAYLLYQRYLSGELKNRAAEHQEQLDGQGQAPRADAAAQHEAIDELKAFRETMCREEKGKGTVRKTIKVYFLGIWDCVSSVAVLEQKAPIPVEVVGTAHYVRHAVSVDERRVKFKPALLAQDIYDTRNSDAEDFSEVWFPGCHGDVGGGWSADDDGAKHKTLWRRFVDFCTGKKPDDPGRPSHSPRLQMSDVPLAWMRHELQLVAQKDAAAAVQWSASAQKFDTKFEQWYERPKVLQADGFVHDSLSFGCGTGFLRVLLWRLMENLPLVARWELRQRGDKSLWESVRMPLNGGRARDVPRNAVLHESLIRRLEEDESYKPKNRHGRGTPRCFERHRIVANPVAAQDGGGVHRTYTFEQGHHEADE